MEAKGIVKEVKKNKIVILPYKNTGCGNCNHCSESEKFGSPIELTSDLEFKQGDEIYFSIETKEIAKAGILGYLLPIVFLFLGYFIANLFLIKEIYKILTSFLSFFLSYFIIAFYYKFFHKNLPKIEIKKEANQNCKNSNDNLY